MSTEDARPLRGAPIRPSVSVIIPVRDDAARLRACVALLADQSASVEWLEVIVVDNGSRAAEAAVLAEVSGIRLVTAPAFGSYAARNAGAAVACGDVLAFTDSDCLPRPDWLARGVAALTAAPEALIAGAVDVFAARPEAPTSVELYEQLFGFPQARYVREFHFGVTANLFVSRRVFEKLGGFRTDLVSGGDYEFGRRAWRSGHPVRYCGDAVVRHPARQTWPELDAKINRLLAGRAQLGDAKRERRWSLLKDVGEAIGQQIAIWAAHLSAIDKARVHAVFLRFHATVLARQAATRLGWRS